MFQKFEVRSVHFKADKKLQAYVRRKIGHLDRYVSRHARGSAHLEVYLKESKQKGANHSHCEITLHLPKDTIVIKENGINIYAAVDIAEAKLKQQLQKYKELHASGKLHRKLFARLGQRG